MEKVTPITQSSLHISEEVISTIADEIMKEIPGVYSLASLPVRAKLLRPPSSVKTVRISIADDVAQIDVGIIVNLSYRLKDVCEQVQEAVKAAVQNMAGITVAKVNVSVRGVHMAESAV